MGAGVTQSENKVVLSDWDGLLKYIVSSSDYTLSNGRMVSEKQIGKDVEGSGLDMFCSNI